MLYWLAQTILERTQDTPLEPVLSFLRLFRYLTFRGACAALTALLLCVWIGPRFIRWLESLFKEEYAARAANNARNVPTMGGLMIVLIMDLTTLLWAQWDNTLIQLTLLSAVVLCGLGFYDDYLKITRRNADGAREGVKLWVQVMLAGFIAFYLWRLPLTTNLISQVMVPFYKYPVLTGTAGVIAGLLITVFAIVGTSNAVNLTDGLDGLAIGCTVIVSFVLLIMTYVAGNVNFARYLQITYVPGAGELTVFCAAMIGAGLGFLWFNCQPAEVFMGDTGSLALGGVIGIIAVLVHQPLVLVLAGGVFVLEAGSVLIQRTWFKYTRLRYGEGRRVFLMSPLHHHFQKLGWANSRIVTRFYILGVICAVMALSSLKIR
ncbi:MAG: phospho-N-acetylmuramoyl-pentapeptide-transferase [Verrucomicrobiota bacterium]